MRTLRTWLVFLCLACSDDPASPQQLPLQFEGVIKQGGNVSIPIPSHMEPTGVACWTRLDDAANWTFHEHKPLDGQFCGLFGEPGSYTAVMTLAPVGHLYLIVVN